MRVDGDHEAKSYTNMDFGEMLVHSEYEFNWGVFVLLPIKLEAFGESWIQLVTRGVDLVFSPEPRITDELVAHGVSAVAISLYGNPTFDNMIHAFSDMVAAMWPTEEVKAASKAWNTKFDKAVFDIQAELQKNEAPRRSFSIRPR